MLLGVCSPRFQKEDHVMKNIVVVRKRCADQERQVRFY